jgi:hypothetical protein
VLAFAIAALALITTVSQADFVQTGKLLVSFDAGLEPSTLPRSELAPVTVGFKGTFENLDASDTPALDTMVVRLSRGGEIDSAGLPRCAENRLRGRSSAEALSVCGSALVGEGTVRSALRFPGGKRARSTAKLLLFNARGEVLMHIYTTEPLRGTFLVPMKIQEDRGRFGIALRARFPKIAAGYGYLTGFAMTLHRTYSYRGARHSFVLASCPAPAGFTKVAFELARVTYAFRNGVNVKTAAIRTCSVRG